MKQLLLINPEGATEDEVKTYSVREAARAIIFDEDHKIALLNVSNKGYYKLPGGGIEGTEDPIFTLKRECKEEIGCDIEVIDEIGFIVEYRRIFGIKQISYCYLAKVLGQKGEPNLTDEEKAVGFEPIWVPYAEALSLMSKITAVDIEGRDYIVPRDKALLKAVKNKI